MATQQISTVGVIGLGTMGAGIVEVFARGGYRVIGVESSEEFAERGRSHLQKSTGRAVSRGKLSADDHQAILDRVSITTDMGELAEADLVVEAVPERMELKHQVFGTLDGIVSEQAILASNTSSLSITEIAAGTAHPQRVVGMHFFNPAPVMKLVEVISTLQADDAVVAQVRDLAQTLGKKPIVVADRAGFVANYLLFGYMNSAVKMIENGHVSREDLDTAMHVGAGLPMGPLTLMDLVGLDVCHHIGAVIHGYSHSPVHAPSTSLAQMVTAGRLGRKSGRGFYTYGPSGVQSDELTLAESADAAPSVQRVAVIGAGAVAEELNERLDAAGLTTVHLPDAAGDLSAVSQVDLVIEAQQESEELEPGDGGRDVDDLFSELGEVTAPGTILATVNTYSAVALGAISGRPETTVVLRVHAPTAHGQVVEIGRTVATQDSTIASLRAVVDQLGAASVVCKDRTGLVVDALLIGFLNEAVRMLDEGYASAADIDTAITAGLGYPAGPFATIDHIGADEVLAIAEELYSGSSGFQPHLAPSPLLVEHVLLDRPFTAAST